jgi:AbrB family looped-hinge helix DNA binding protein
MTITLKTKTEITAPKGIRRKASIKPGDRVEFSVSGRVIKIIPKLSPDELQDDRDVRDPKVRAAIRKSHQEVLAGESRPAEEFFAERASRARKRSD